MKTLRALALLLSTVGPAIALGACVSEPEPAEDSANLGEKTGLLGLSPDLKFDETAKGFVEGAQLDIYALKLRGGDKITVTETIVEGDAAPDALLFLGGATQVKSKTFEANGPKLVKNYEIATTGQYYLGVRAFKGEKSGRYTIKAVCTGGPCNGEPVVEKLDQEQAGECVRMARECAFVDMVKFDGAVGPVRARALFEDCLGKTMLEDEGLSCKQACDVEGGRAICDGIIDIIPFYADASAACVSTLSSCVDSCYDGAGGLGLVEGPEDICFLNGFNGTCDSYARGHEACGGSYEDGSVEECHALCQSTFGAWNDDLDTICSDDCGDLPE